MIYTRVYQKEFDAELRAVFAQHDIDNSKLIEDIITLAQKRAERYHDGLSAVECELLEAGRFRNMKAFPIVQSIAMKAANMAAHAMGRSLPFSDHFSAHLLK